MIHRRAKVKIVHQKRIKKTSRIIEAQKAIYANRDEKKMIQFLFLSIFGINREAFSRKKIDREKLKIISCRTHENITRVSSLLKMKV
jgi:hypothetical protein